MINWIVSNKEWLFSGIGVFVSVFIIRIAISLLKDNKNHQYENNRYRFNTNSVSASSSYRISNANDTIKNENKSRDTFSKLQIKILKHIGLNHPGNGGIQFNYHIVRNFKDYPALKLEHESKDLIKRGYLRITNSQPSFINSYICISDKAKDFLVNNDLV